MIFSVFSTIGIIPLGICSDAVSEDKMCIRDRVKGDKITMLTAYDYSTAKLMDQSGINGILVGDSLGMVDVYKRQHIVRLDE